MADNKTLNKPAETDLNQSPAPPADPLRALLQKKLNYLKRKIIIGIISFFGLLTLIAIIFLYYLDVKKTNEAQINQIVTYLNNVKNKTSDIKLKITDAKKYKEIWNNTAENKKSFEGPNINEINSKFNELSEKYHIINPSIKISVPEVLKGGIYDRSTIDVAVSSVSITFDAITDISAITFIKEFTDTLPGYIVITDFYVKKIPENGFSANDLVNISIGKFAAGVNSKLEFSWYILKKKSGSKKL